MRSSSTASSLEDFRSSCLFCLCFLLFLSFLSGVVKAHGQQVQRTESLMFFLKRTCWQSRYLSRTAT